MPPRKDDASTEFKLDRNITVAGSAAGISLGGGTDVALFRAIEQDNAFPDGTVSIGRLTFGAKTNSDIAFTAPGNVRVKFGASVEARLAAGIFPSSSSALGALEILDAPGLDLKLPTSSPGDRFFVVLTGYKAAGHIEATHPLGALGSVTFGTQADRASVFAVIHRFGSKQNTAAKTVIADTVSSWRLPRHVAADGGGVNLKPATWLVAEVDGSIAVKLAAQLGYDVSFAKEATLRGVTENLSVKIDASLKLALGFTVSGRYLLVVGREDTSSNVRLRMLKLSKKGLNIGLNLDVGIQATLPDDFKKADDFVKTIFGQHGLQVLEQVRKWADPDTPLAENVAKLATDKGFELLQAVTGINAEAEFNKGRALLHDVLDQWDKLPDTVSAFLWTHLGASNAKKAELKTFLQALANQDKDTRAKALADAIAGKFFSDSPIAQFLQAVAEEGILALPLEQASQRAGQVLDILNGGLVSKLHDFVEEKLNLKLIRDGSFDNLDSWLVARLADFLNKTALGSQDLKEVQAAITALDQKARDLYAKGVQAATKRYNATFAATYQRTTTDTALLDVTFDLQQASAGRAFTEVLDGRLDRLLVEPIGGVSIGQAVLSHSIERRSDVSLHLPFGAFDTTHINNAVASLSIEEQAGRVLIYDFQGDDRISKSRYLSDLSVLGRVKVENGQPTLDVDGTIAYESLQVKQSMQGRDLQKRTESFIRENFSRTFGGEDASLQTFYADLDDAVGGDGNKLGDVALSMQVAYPVTVLIGWLRRRDSNQRLADACAISLQLQRTLRRLLAEAFFQDLDNFEDNESTAALLVWSCMPITTSIDFNGSSITRFDTRREPFWDSTLIDLRRAMAHAGHTVAELASALDDAQKRLAEAGRSRADRFGRAKTGHFIEVALDHQGDINLQTLLNFEKGIVSAARGALDSISDAWAGSVTTAPTVAVKALAEWAARLTQTFNSGLANIYTTAALRSLGPLVLAEASAALGDSGLANAKATAMLRMYFFKDPHAFGLERFMKNELPPSDDVRFVQTLATP